LLLAVIGEELFFGKRGLALLNFARGNERCFLAFGAPHLARPNLIATATLTAFRSVTHEGILRLLSFQDLAFTKSLPKSSILKYVRKV
jgi:hypothetical protein